MALWGNEYIFMDMSIVMMFIRVTVELFLICLLA